MADAVNGEEKQTPTETLTLRCKVVILGEPTVGKTALISQFESGLTKYPKAYNMTTGVEVVEKEVSVDIDPPNGLINKVVFHLYDCGGNELFRDVAAPFLKSANFVLYCYNMTKKETFEKIGDWMSLFLANCESSSVTAALVALKLDLEDFREVTEEQGKHFAAQNNMRYFEATSQERRGVNEIFEKLASLFVQSYEAKREMIDVMSH